MKKSIKVIITFVLLFVSSVGIYYFGFINGKNNGHSGSVVADNNEKSQPNQSKKKKELLPEVKEQEKGDKENTKGHEVDNRPEEITQNQNSNQNIKPNNPQPQKDSNQAEPEILNGVKIGKRHKLNVATQAQQKWHWCAPTTVSMMLSARGKNISQSQLAREMGTYEPFGTHNKDAVRILNRHVFGYDFPSGNQAGYRIETVRDKSPETLNKLKNRIIQNTKDGYPMYFTFNPGKVYPGVINAEHNVAGAGYIATPDGNDIAFIYYVDPYGKFHDKTYGGLKIITPEKLINAMVDPYVTEPNYAW